MAEIFHVDYLYIQVHINCTHGHFSQLQMVTSVNYGQLASDAITSTPVNLNTDIFHADYLDIEVRLHCTHGHFSQLKAVSFRYHNFNTCQVR